MRICVLVILSLSSFIVNAQDDNQSSVDSLEHNRNNRFVLYAAPIYSLNQFAETNASYGGIGLGLIIKDRIDVLVYYSQIMDSFKKQIIFPSNHEYDQVNFSLNGQYSFLKKSIRPHIGAGVAYAKLAWEPLHDSNDTFSEYIFIYSLFAGANWAINRFLSLQGNFGYNFAGDVEIVGLESTDFTGFKLDLMLKIKLLNIR